MNNVKYVNGRLCYYNEVVFAIDDFHDEYDQAQFADMSTGPYIMEVEPDTQESFNSDCDDLNQDQFTMASYRARLIEAERPIYMRLKFMVRDVKMLIGSTKLDAKKLDRLKRIFVDDLTSLIQEASDITISNGNSQTIDIILKLSILNDPEITKAGRQFGITLRQINRIREKLHFLPKQQQEKLNTALVNLTSLITDKVFNSVNLKVYQ